MPGPSLGWQVARILFWLALAGIGYTYLGYGVLIAALAHLRPRPVHKAEITPTVTVLVAAYNEEACIAAKIENTLALDYPSHKLAVVVVADGSTDGTRDLVSSHPSPRVRLLYEPERRGKVGALLRALPYIESEVILFSDANSLLPSGALRALAYNLADPQVGGVSGAKRMLGEGDTAAGAGEGLYWRYESFLKACDSAASSVMGAPGEIWAVRRAAYVPPEPDTLLDDLYSSMRMVLAGWRVVFEPEALAYEAPSPSLGAEWQRRARNAAGGWQACFQLWPALRRAPALVVWQFLSHRMLRWMVTPWLLPLALAANLGLLSTSFYRLTLGLQVGFYALAGLGWLLARTRKPTGRGVGWLLAPFYLCFLNAAALAGGWRFLSGRQSVVWRKVR